MDVNFVLTYIFFFIVFLPLVWRMVPGLRELCEDLVNFWVESWEGMVMDAKKAFKRDRRGPDKKQTLSESFGEINEICSYIKETFLLRITSVICYVLDGITKFLKWIMGV